MRVIVPRAAVCAARRLLVPVAAAGLLLPSPAAAAPAAAPVHRTVAAVPAVSPAPSVPSAAPAPAPSASLSRTAVTNGRRAANSLKAIAAGFAVGLLALVAAMVVTVRRHRRAGSPSGQ
ncbi:hypothetical protein [Streptomyces manipurensis]|uniref:hypothetical protein n=1 Tax=Streptomyces manipurensis TaxID=1077945 RepID=UPI003C6EDED8